MTLRDEVDGSAPEAPLAARLKRGLGWSVVNTVVARLGSLVSGVILARILTPEDYGSYAVALVVLNAMLSMNELGVSLAVVRWKDDPAEIAPTVTTLALGTSVLLYAVSFIVAPFIASVLNAPDAVTMIRVVCLCVMTDAFTSTSAALIARAFQQERRLVVDLLGFVLGTGVSVVLALRGMGAWSMIWGLIVANVVSGATSLVLAPRRYAPGFDRTVVRRLVSFGLPLAGSSALLFIMLNVDYIIVGHLLGAASLGLYLMAFNLCSWPVNIISTTIRRLSLAAFSRAAESPTRVRRAFGLALHPVLVGTLAICIPLAVFAGPMLHLLYGDQWVGATDAVRFLVVFAVGRVLTELVFDYFIAVDRNRLNLWLQAIWLLFLVPVLVAGATWWGVTGVAVGHAVVVLAVVFPALVVGLRSAGVGPRELWRVARRPLATVVPAVAFGVGALVVIPGSVMPVLLGGGVTALAYAVLNRGVLREYGSLGRS